MSERSDLERDIAEEDELRALLRAGDGPLAAAPFEVIERRMQGRRSQPALTAVVLALLAIVAAVGIGTWRVATPATSPSPSPAVTSPSPSPTAAATALPQVGPPSSSALGLCPEAPRPAYLPWSTTPSTHTQVQTTPTSTETTLFGPGAGAAQALVRILVQLYADSQPTTNPQTAGGRRVFVYFVPATVRQPAEARAWWREPTSACPVVTVALVWPDKDPITQQTELLRVVESIPSLAASPPATARPTAGYGVLVRRPDGTVNVLHEDGSAPAALDARTDVLAASPDGRDIAYWGGSDARELWVAQSRDLQQRRMLLTLANERGTGIVWSPDGASLMFAAASTTFGPGPEAAPTYTALRVISLDGSAPRELAHIATGQFIRPVAWDGTRGIGAAEEGLGQKGPGRYISVATFPLVIDGGNTSNVRFMDLPDARDASVVVGQLQASSDARFVIATWSYGDRDLVRFWPLEGLDLGRMRDLTPEQVGDKIRGAAWRPKSLEIGVNTAGHFQLWTLDGERRQVRSLEGSAVSLAFRYDGSALYSAPVGSGQLELTDLIAPSFSVRQLPPASGPVFASVDLAEGR